MFVKTFSILAWFHKKSHQGQKSLAFLLSPMALYIHTHGRLFYSTMLAIKTSKKGV